MIFLLRINSKCLIFYLENWKEYYSKIHYSMVRCIKWKESDNHFKVFNWILSSIINQATIFKKFLKSLIALKLNMLPEVSVLK